MGKQEPTIVIRFSGRAKGIASQVDRCVRNHGAARIADDPVHSRCLRGQTRESQNYE